MPEFVLEVGCEELPASFVRKAYGELEGAVVQRLQDQQIPFGDHESLGTPRRLIVRIADVAERQPDITKDMRGPSTKAAFEADGSPSKALQGFCRGQGVDPANVRVEGEYVWVTKTTEGRSTREVFAEILPEAIRSITFDKAMRWGSNRMRFARPIRWIYCTLGGEIVSFSVEDVTSSNESRGHRFNHPEAFAASGFAELVAGLRERQVEPDAAKREALIRAQATERATGTPLMTDALVDENVFLTEWPTAIQGTFREEYLELPGPVLITAMAKHEKFFPIREADKITNRFISIRNGGVDDVVRNGNEWVLNARFNDARFFFEEDKKRSLDEFLQKTEGIVFADKLGTVRERAERLSTLCARLARDAGLSENEIQQAAQAGRYAKADLSTGLVSELPALQGLIGAEYAARAGLPAEVCAAIASQYDLSKCGAMDSPATRIAACLIAADQLDKLAGYLGVGLTPSGSSDPYGLRRAATLLVETALRWPSRLFYSNDTLKLATSLYGDLPEKNLHATLWEICRSRYEYIFEGARHDILEAATAAEMFPGIDSKGIDPQKVRFRIEVLKKLADDVPFVQTATRPLNIIAAAFKKGEEYDFNGRFDEKMLSDSGAELAALVKSLESSISAAADSMNVDGLIQELRKLDGPINGFFDSTMVMDSDPLVRHANLSLMQAISMLLVEAGDFSKIVIPGA